MAIPADNAAAKSTIASDGLLPRSRTARRDVSLLAACHGLGISAAVVSVTVSALAATEIAGSGGWATVPYGIQFLAVLMTTWPASLLMQRHGRRPVFLLAALSGIGGGLFGAAGIVAGSFPVLCLAHALLGVMFAIVNFFRFAALDVASPARRASAMSLVLFGGTFAALLGPMVSRGAGSVFPVPLYAAAYLGIAVIGVTILFLLAAVRFPPPAPRLAAGSRPVPISPFLSSPQVLAGLACGAVGYGFMNLLMIGCSIEMSGHGMAFSTISYAIQLHVLAMYLPSLVMGPMIARFGGLPIVAAGATLMALAALAAIELSHTAGFFASLILLGLGWNAMYLGGSSLVASEAPEAVKFRLQGINDLCVGIAAMLGAFLPGLLLSTMGWQAMNAMVLVVSLGLGLAVAVTAARQGRQPAPRPRTTRP